MMSLFYVIFRHIAANCYACNSAVTQTFGPPRLKLGRLKHHVTIEMTTWSRQSHYIFQLRKPPFAQTMMTIEP